jgi:3'-phosphoadenosine 5'-phosphosulfate sulfotransferase (PAPS reductase)/FAD synthetase
MLAKGSGQSAPWLTQKVKRAYSVIEQWIHHTSGNVYASVSGGKDSLVMAHLIRQVLPDCPFVWVNQGPLAEWPDCVELLYSLKDKGWNIVELCPAQSLWNLYRQYGVPLDGKMTTKIDKIINQKLMYDPLDQYQDSHHIRGYAWGIRKESKGRIKYLISKGELYQRIDRIWVCSPVGFWSTQDIWNYIDKESLDYPAFYDENRMTVRNGPPIGTTGINYGRLARIRRFYPEVWDIFSKHFPEVVNYV